MSILNVFFFKNISFKEIFKIFLFFITLMILHILIIKDRSLDSFDFQLFESIKSETTSEIIPQQISRQINSIIVPREELLKIGFKIWKEKPIFGHGLGKTRYKVYEEIDSDKKGISPIEKTPISLHNTFIWILCEMGLIGLIIFIFFPSLIIVKILRDKFVNNTKLNNQDFSFLLIIFITFIFSLVHDILYQRVLWISLAIIVSKKYNEYKL